MKIETGRARDLLILLVITALVASGAFFSFPGQADAAAKTTYNVTILSESPSVALISVSNGTLFSQQGTGEGITFQMIVDGKAKTEKVNSTKGTATYYPVAINKIKIPDTYFTQDGNKFKVTTKAANAKGKLYVSGGDVDVSQVMGEKTAKETIGDGTANAENSLIVPISLVVTTFGPSGKKMMTFKTLSTWTTGQSRTEVKKSKSGLEGKALPDDSPAGGLPNPLVGAPLDLNAGTGTLVSTAAIMNIKIDPKGAPAAPEGGFSVDSTLNELVADPGAHAVLEEAFGSKMADLEANLGIVGSWTLRSASKMSPQKVDLDAINAALAALSSGGAPPPVSLVGDADLLCGQVWSLQITPAKK
jgi:hypothetical protein